MVNPPDRAVAETLTFATVAPSRSAWVDILGEVAGDIDAASEGRVSLKLYTAGVMGDDRAMFRKIRRGELDGAVLATAAFERVFADMHLYNLPMVFRDIEEVDKARAQFDPVLKQGVARHGLLCLGFVEVGMAYAMSTRRIRAVAQVPGLRIWVPAGDAAVETITQGFGATPDRLQSAMSCRGFRQA